MSGTQKAALELGTSGHQKSGTPVEGNTLREGESSHITELTGSCDGEDDAKTAGGNPNPHVNWVAGLTTTSFALPSAGTGSAFVDNGIINLVSSDDEEHTNERSAAPVPTVRETEEEVEEPQTEGTSTLWPSNEENPGSSSLSLDLHQECEHPGPEWDLPSLLQKVVPPGQEYDDGDYVDFDDEGSPLFLSGNTKDREDEHKGYSVEDSLECEVRTDTQVSLCFEKKGQGVQKHVRGR